MSMAIKNTSFQIIVGTAPLTAVAIVQATYARLSEVVVTNRYEAELIPNTAKATDPTASDMVQVFNKVQSVTGKLDLFTLDTDPANGIPAVIPSQEFSCDHVSGSIPEAELYTHIMSLPEFSGSVAV